MANQDVIQFPTCDQVVRAVQASFERQTRASVDIIDIAKRLYAARSAWVGGGTLDWADLTPRQKSGYMREIELLIVKAQGEK